MNNEEQKQEEIIEQDSSSIASADENSVVAVQEQQPIESIPNEISEEVSNVVSVEISEEVSNDSNSTSIEETAVETEAVISEPAIVVETEAVIPEPAIVVETEAVIPEPVIVEVNETPAEEVQTEQIPEVSDEEKQKRAEEEAISRSQRQKYFDEVFNELKAKMENNEVIEVEIKSRIRGGLRVHYKELPLFLPTSHFTLKRNPTEEEMQESIDKVVKVYIHEYQEFDEGRKAVIVSRKKILLDEIWDNLQVGQVIDGRISSVATFGIFVEFDGLEGLIHISRLSKFHVDDPSKIYKRGQEIKAKIIDVDKSKNRIALSRKELEDSPWKGCEEEFKAGTQINGIVRRLTEFGAYIELKPGVDGLLRNNELSWTKRVKKSADMLKPGQQISVEIISISEEKENASLSYKRTLPNPWASLAEQYPVGSEFNAVILQVIPQGAIVSLNENLDGFMPRSKMRPMMKGKKIPYKSGDQIEVVITDINPNEESLILAPKLDEEATAEMNNQQHRPPREDRRHNQPAQNASNANNASFSLGDFLSDTAMEKLQNINK